MTMTMTNNETLACQLVHLAVEAGVKEFYICPGARCAPLLQVLSKQPKLIVSYGFEERSTAFYALGRARKTGRPVAVVTTSGTAVGELLPAMMEAFYTGTPLLAITADRPRRFRGTGSPQSAEQVEIFGHYTPCFWDIAESELFSFTEWDFSTPAHLNVCFEEPLKGGGHTFPHFTSTTHVPFAPNTPSEEALDTFFTQSERPWVIVGGLLPSDRESVVSLLLQLQVPIYLEATSGLREDHRLAPLTIRCIENVWERALVSRYPIDGVLRIGNIPTLRAFRDLEDMEGMINVLSLNSLPFSGLSWGSHLQVPLASFLNDYVLPKTYDSLAPEKWLKRDRSVYELLINLFLEEPSAEPSLFYQLSQRIPKNSHIYLGNSLPIREWDLAASYENRHFDVTASRGLNGIDGQISQFLGMSSPKRDNWAILGDLTTLYDMAGPWAIKDQPELPITIVTVNNGGGQIFSRMFAEREFINPHSMPFEPLAKLWGFHYEAWEGTIPQQESTNILQRLIELIPDPEATERFWQKLQKLRKS